MTMSDEAAGHAIAWTFHRNTMRFAHNAEPPDGDATPLPPREDAALPFMPLPEAGLPGALGALVRQRLSCRRFADREVPLEALATLLHLGYGLLGTDRSGRLEFPRRPVPSGGGLYPLELTVIANRVAGLKPGVHHHVPVVRGLEQVLDGAVPAGFLDYLFMGQSALARAPAVLVVSGIWRRTLTKYGDRGYRYMLLEAGHLVQNINLGCLELGLGSCNIGGFFDQELAGLLGMDIVLETPLYAVAIGWPDGDDPMALRDL